MKVVIQRVSSSTLSVENKIISKIETGFVIYFGVQAGDNQEELEYIIKKCSNLRVFEDENGKMNKSIKDINGQILLVSQFTLMGDCKDGNRPSFIEAEKPEIACAMYEEAKRRFEENQIETKMGIFGADMTIRQVNIGPCTIIIDSRERKKATSLAK